MTTIQRSSEDCSTDLIPPRTMRQDLTEYAKAYLSCTQMGTKSWRSEWVDKERGALFSLYKLCESFWHRRLKSHLILLVTWRWPEQDKLLCYWPGELPQCKPLHPLPRSVVLPCDQGLGGELEQRRWPKRTTRIGRNRKWMAEWTQTYLIQGYDPVPYSTLTLFLRSLASFSESI